MEGHHIKQVLLVARERHSESGQEEHNVTVTTGAAVRESQSQSGLLPPAH